MTDRRRSLVRIGVRVGGRPAAVFLDEESSLPVRVEMEGGLAPAIELHDYTIVEGIRVPRRLVLQTIDGGRFELRYCVAFDIEQHPDHLRCNPDTLVLPASWR